MLSVKNRGIGISQGGVDTSLMMMKSNPELFLKIPLNPKIVDGYEVFNTSTKESLNIIKSAQPKIVSAKSFKIVQGYEVKTITP